MVLWGLHTRDLWGRVILHGRSAAPKATPNLSRIDLYPSSGEGLHDPIVYTVGM